MNVKEMIEELDELKDFFERISAGTAIICLHDTYSNREFIKFAKSIAEYKHIKLIIHEGDLPRNGIRMRDIDDVIRLRKSKILA